MLNLLSEIFTINTATLSGCIDVIVIKQPDGTLVSSPFHLRFGKLKVLKSSDKILSVKVNGQATDLVMKLGSAGEGYFLHETMDENYDDDLRASSPAMSSGEASPNRNYSSGDENDEQERLQQEAVKMNDLEQIEQKLKELDQQLVQKNDDDLIDAQASDQINTSTSTQNTQKPTPVLQDLDEEEKVDLRLLQQSPKAIQRSIEEQFKQELEKEKEKQNDGLSNKNDKKVERKSRWTWFWGELPEKQIKDQQIEEVKQTEETTGLQQDQQQDDQQKQPPQIVLEQDSSPQRIEQIPQPDQILISPQEDSSQVLSSPQQQRVVNKDQNNQQLENVQATAQLLPNQPNNIMDLTQPSNEQEKKGFLRRMFGYFKKSPSEQPLLIDSSQQQNVSSNNLNGYGQHQMTTEEEDEASEINLSLCAHLIMPIDGVQKSDEEIIMAFENHKITYEQFCQSPHLLLMDSRLVIRIEDQYYNWATAAPFIISMLAFKQPLSTDIIVTNDQEIDMNQQQDQQQQQQEQIQSYQTQSQQQQHQHQKITNAKDLPQKNFQDDSPIQQNSAKKQKVHYRKSLTPTSDQLKKLNLHDGSNDIIFKVTTGLLGEQQIQGRIFVWDHTYKIVISDVDGTVTKSDMLGHLLPRFGRDWTHQGIAKLYTSIAKNGYKILYLSSRPIGLADTTREYLKGIKQDENFNMPDGPVIMSPDRMVKSMTREVILKKPQMFKIAALKNIYNLFPEESNPFVGGFGNRDTDAISYRAVGISLDKIFIVNDDGEIYHFNSQNKKSYSLLNDIVDDMYPSVLEGLKQLAETVKDSVGNVVEKIEDKLLNNSGDKDSQDDSDKQNDQNNVESLKIYEIADSKDLFSDNTQNIEPNQNIAEPQLSHYDEEQSINNVLEKFEEGKNEPNQDPVNAQSSNTLDSQGSDNTNQNNNQHEETKDQEDTQEYSGQSHRNNGDKALTNTSNTLTMD
eukprot:403353152